MRFHPSALALAAATLLPLAAAAQQRPAAGPPASRVPVPAIDPANVDRTAAACTDFYQFANGGWLRRTERPAAYSTWGSFNELADKNTDVVRAILDTLRANAATAAPGSSAQKVGLFYGSCMDSTAAERAGAEPIRPVLREIAAIGSTAQLRASLGALERRAGLAPFGFGAQQDPKQSTSVIAVLNQGGLGLPDRDYYTRTDSASAGLRAAYRDHVAASLRLAGEPADAARRGADAVLRIETALAGASMTRVQQRDPNAVYHRMTVAEAQRLTPGLDWTRFMREVGARDVAAINVRQPDFFRALDSLLGAAPLADWKAYLRWRAVDGAAPSLSAAFVNEDFRWQSGLTGAKALLPRWRRCANATDAALGEAVGEEYVKRTFTPEAKARALAMVNELRGALERRIGALAWMGPETKRQANAKLAAFARKIGYPDRWRDYSALEVRAGSFYANQRRAADFALRRDLAKIGRPVDRAEWGMTPPTVNAYYNPSMNEIVFPAGILQPPFFDVNADDAVNYGGMGAVIGHEMTHGFDDQGRQFDAAGNLREWWTPADAAAYTARAKLVSDQFDAYTVVDSATRVNGKLTLGENIADLGGITVAYDAFQKSIENKRLAPIDGFTPAQRFFLSWAQIWRTLQTPEAARLQVNVDPHAPGQWRVNGPLSNMPEFAAAFGCKPGDPMVRAAAQQAQIW